MDGGSRIRGFLREPLLHFVAVGALLFLARALWAPFDGKRIVVSRESANGLAAAREELLQRSLSADERERVLSDFVDEEVLLREAYRQGLDRGDPRIRRWLVDKMEFLLEEDPGEPTPAQLDALFREKPESYRTPRAVSFDHLFFATGTPLPEAPEAILSRLRAGGDVGRWGDEFWLGKSLRRFSELELRTTFGGDFTTRVLALPMGDWRGPIESSRGVHFVRVTETHEPEVLSRADVDWELREDWRRARREESRARKLAELRARYRVEIQSN